MKNIKALLPNELDYINNKYSFEIAGNYVIVACQGYDRKVAHEKDRGFTINTPIRKVTITTQAIEVWEKNFYDTFSLLRVQNAINELIITYQDTTIENITDQLLRGNSQIYTY